MWRPKDIRYIAGYMHICSSAYRSLCFNGIKEAVVVLHEALQKRPRDYGTQGIYNILGNYMQTCTTVKMVFMFVLILLYY